MEITYYIEKHYGIERVYIVDPRTAKNVSEMTRRATLDTRDMRALEALGFTLKEVIKPR